jgi:ribose 5-phosphate isomerase B
VKIALSTDHAGYERLKKLKEGLELAGYACHDFGPAQFNVDDDYPDYIKPACESILAGGCQLGVIFGGSGQGEAMAANRFKGIRCMVWYGPSVPIEAVNAEGMMSSDPYELLKLSREHNNANMISIAGRFVNDDETLKVVVKWLNESFKNEERHQRRITKLDQLS